MKEPTEAPPRSECVDGPRPCIRACRFRLSGGGASCALDVAADGEHTLAEVGAYFGVTRERIRQIEMKALRKLHLAVARGAAIEGAAERLRRSDVKHDDERRISARTIGKETKMMDPKTKTDEQSQTTDRWDDCSTWDDSSRWDAGREIDATGEPEPAKEQV